MNTVNDFEWGEFVKCNGQIMFVQDSDDEDNPGMIGLQTEDATKVYDHDWSDYFPEVKYYPISEIERLKPVKADASVLRNFFRMERTPWILAAEGHFPFSKDTEPFDITEEDLEILVARFSEVDSIFYDTWETAFYGMKLARCQETAPEEMSLAFAWNMMLGIFHWFDPEEDSAEYITDIWEFYKEAKGKPLTQVNIPEYFRSNVLARIEDYAEGHTPTEDQVILYNRLLDELCGEGDTWALEHKAYAYYGGNGVVPCDWEKSEQALLLLYEQGNMSAANSLGYIYYSERLGAPDYEKAFFYFSRAAEAGIIEAKYKLSDMYRKGHGTEKNPAKAFEILKKLYDGQRKSYEDGYYSCKLADVALRIGYCYENGDGVAKDIIKAREYFEIAKEAISKRMEHGKHFGDDTVRRNIEAALERVPQVVGQNRE